MIYCLLRLKKEKRKGRENKWQLKSGSMVLDVSEDR
jgi:hypothetical protein